MQFLAKKCVPFSLALARLFQTVLKILLLPTLRAGNYVPFSN